MNKNNLFLRKTLLSVAIGALLAIMVTPALAALQTEDSALSPPTSGQYMTRLYPHSGGQMGAMWFSFNATKGGYLTNVTVQLRREGSTDMYARCIIQQLNASSYAGYPNGTDLTSSINTVSANSLNTIWTNASFYFSGDYQLTAGVFYAAIIGVEGWSTPATPTYADCLVMGRSPSSTAAYSGFDGAGALGSWDTYSTADMYYIVESNTASSSGGLPSDWGGGLTDYDEIIADFTSFMVPLIVVLLPALLLMFLTRRTDKWLLLIGITIGAGLGYYFGMVPLWLVFLVTIGLIGMAYQSVRGGGN